MTTVVISRVVVLVDQQVSKSPRSYIRSCIHAYMQTCIHAYEQCNLNLESDDTSYHFTLTRLLIFSILCIHAMYTKY